MSLEDLIDGSPITVNILAQAAAQSPAGGPAREPYSVVLAAVPAALAERSGVDRRENSKATMIKRLRFYFRYDDLQGLRLTTKHRIEVIDPNPAANNFPGNRECVVETVSNVNSLNVLIQVDASEQAA